MGPAMPYSQGSSGPAPPDTDSRVPVINLKDGTRLAGDDAPRRKDLEQWLMEHPGFVADTGAFIPVSPLMKLKGKSVRHLDLFPVATSLLEHVL